MRPVSDIESQLLLVWEDGVLYATLAYWISPFSEDVLKQLNQCLAYYSSILQYYRVFE